MLLTDWLLSVCLGLAIYHSPLSLPVYEGPAESVIEPDEELDVEVQHVDARVLSIADTLPRQ